MKIAAVNFFIPLDPDVNQGEVNQGVCPWPVIHGSPILVIKAKETI